MALTASEAINYHVWDTQLPAVTYLNGLFLFVAGVSILRRLPDIQGLLAFEHELNREPRVGA